MFVFVYKLNILESEYIYIYIQKKLLNTCNFIRTTERYIADIGSASLPARLPFGYDKKKNMKIYPFR